MTESLTVKNPNIGKDLLQAYQDDPSQSKVHCLIVGDKNVGKTSILKTAPKPVLIFSFDPGGTIVLIKEKECGDIIVINCENDNVQNPVAYMKFQNEFNRLGNADFYNDIATVVIDPVTSFNDCAIWQVRKKEGKIMPAMDVMSTDKTSMAYRDWDTMLSMYAMWARRFSALPCHTFWMGHILRDFDDVRKTHIIKLMITGQAKDRVMNLIPDLWFMKISAKGERYLLMDYEDGCPAGTKIGSEGRFEKHEKPDIKYLLKKAGLDYEDRPGFGTNRKEGTTGWDQT